MATKILQILDSLGSEIYTQAEEPVDAKDGALWVDTDEKAHAAQLDTTLSVEGAAADAAAVGEAVKNATVKWVNW